MASKPAARCLRSSCLRLNAPLASAPACRQLFTGPQFLSFQSSRAASRAQILSPASRNLFRRSYADVAPLKPKKKRAGFFRWTWRFIYLSTIGGVGYLAFTIYLLRTPSEQVDPSPSKKTLIILGIPSQGLLNAFIDRCRYWLGSCISSQET